MSETAAQTPASIEIRDYRPFDREAMLGLIIELQAFEGQFEGDRCAPDREFAEWYLARLLREVPRLDGVLSVATLADTACGFVAAWPEEEPEARDWYFLIAELAVAERHRSRGIGTRLIRSIEEIARARGVARIGIGVLAGSERVHRFYRRLGYRDYAMTLRKGLAPSV